jgi:hypothetical protein
MTSFVYNNFDPKTSLSDSKDPRKEISGVKNIPLALQRVAGVPF